MGRISAWFGGLTTGKKALVLAGGLVAFAVLSPLVVPLAWLFLLLSALVVGYRLLRGRPYRTPGAFLLGSLIVLVLASGASGALYGTSTEQASSGQKPRAEAEHGKARRESKQEEAKAEDITPETSAEPAKPPPEKTAERAAAKPEPEPKPKPEPAPEPEPKLAPAEDEVRSPYDATVTVSGVVDGDTIEVTPAIQGVEDVRLIGVDTPETVDPSEEVEPYGPEASAFATQELAGAKVRLEFGQEKFDEYDRLLAYVYAGGQMFNEELVEGGYAQAYPYPPNTRYAARFETAQAEAMAEDVGIWGLPLAQQCKLADRGNGIGEGTAECSASPSASASPSTSAQAEPSDDGAVAPISEDDCPPNAPVKGNQSGLYHVPGGAYYDVTNPEECFATAEDAEDAGYEASSR